jgi:outer membrane protein assembly factor BamB
MLITAAGLVGALVIAQVSPLDYTQWRGRDRDGSASAFVEPKLWPEKLSRRWKVEVGEGYATPLVIGDRVYVFSRRDGKEVMTALRAADGTVVWQTGYVAPYKMGAPTKAHGEGPKATPLYHRGKLFTLGIAGIVTAFDAATGKIAWQRPAPAEQPFFGTAVSPVGDGALVIVHVGDEGPLIALDASTGEVRWEWTGGGAAFASPIVVELEGVRQVVTITPVNVVGVAVRDGSLLWKHPWQQSTPSATAPIPFGGTFVVGGQAMGLAAIRPVRQGTKWTTEVAWATKDVSLFLSNPVLVGRTLFGLSEKSGGQYFALDAATGKILWLGPPRAAKNTAVVATGELLFLLNDDAELIVARASPERFDVVKRYRVAESATWAQPAISGKRVFVKDVSSVALWVVE